MNAQKDLVTVNDLIKVLRDKPGKDYALEALLDVLPRLLEALHPTEVTSNKEVDALAEWMRERESQCGAAADFLENSMRPSDHKAAIQFLRGAEKAWCTASVKVQNLHVIPF